MYLFDLSTGFFNGFANTLCKRYFFFQDFGNVVYGFYANFYCLLCSIGSKLNSISSHLGDIFLKIDFAPILYPKNPSKDKVLRCHQLHRKEFQLRRQTVWLHLRSHQWSIHQWHYHQVVAYLALVVERGLQNRHNLHQMIEAKEIHIPRQEENSVKKIRNFSVIFKHCGWHAILCVSITSFFCIFQITIKTVLQYFLTDKNVEILCIFPLYSWNSRIERNGASG